MPPDGFGSLSRDLKGSTTRGYFGANSMPKYLFLSYRHSSWLVPHNSFFKKDLKQQVKHSRAFLPVQAKSQSRRAYFSINRAKCQSFSTTKPDIRPIILAVNALRTKHAFPQSITSHSTLFLYKLDRLQGVIFFMGRPGPIGAGI